ncbi:MAG: TIGR03915 family putative DNA repair protein [Chitinophagales bacterium]|nr:TIGR03915 family putative DNA repair protein [Chitinophagales bacterium]
MVSIRYSGGFGGLLTAVFETYRLKLPKNLNVMPMGCSNIGLFDETITVEEDSKKANRVRSGIIKIGGKAILEKLYHAYLSEQPNADTQIAAYIRLMVDSKRDISGNHLEPCIRDVMKMAQLVRREEHRMHAFVRFQRTQDDVYFAAIAPTANVVPLLGSFFQRRYPAQQWLIYDEKRQYGIYYDLEKVSQVELDLPLQGRDLPDYLLMEGERQYQRLWKDYFDAVNIPERKNMKLHIRHVPKRYWKYLPEKFLESTGCPNFDSISTVFGIE